jgi:hypothetical protein
MFRIVNRGIRTETPIPDKSVECMASDDFSVPSPISRKYAGMARSLVESTRIPACDVRATNM